MAFEAILARPDERPRRWRRAMLTTSLAIHAIALTVAVVRSQWEVDEMAVPPIQVTLTEAPPPPPPPPPPAGSKKPSTKPKVIKVPTKAEIVQPKETPKEEPKEEEPESEDNGVAGGVAGGVANGVVGGVVGATPPPPPPKPTGPEMVETNIGRQQLLVDTNVPPYCCPKIPRALEQVDTFSADVRVCVTVTGQVYDARIMRGGEPAIDAQIPGFVRRWRYRPLLRDGQPIPFCYVFRYEITQR